MNTTAEKASRENNQSLLSKLRITSPNKLRQRWLQTSCRKSTKGKKKTQDQKKTQRLSPRIESKMTPKSNLRQTAQRAQSSQRTQSAQRAGRCCQSSQMRSPPWTETGMATLMGRNCKSWSGVVGRT